MGQITHPGAYQAPGAEIGAPPDDANFKINLNEQGRYNERNRPFTYTETLIVTGHSDPMGGSVCGIYDTDQPQQFRMITDTGIPNIQTVVFSCTGTYKSGNLTYTQTVVSNVVTLNDKGSEIICTMRGPHVNKKVSGSYTAGDR